MWRGARRPRRPRWPRPPPAGLPRAGWMLASMVVRPLTARVRTPMSRVRPLSCELTFSWFASTVRLSSCQGGAGGEGRHAPGESKTGLLRTPRGLLWLQTARGLLWLQTACGHASEASPSVCGSRCLRVRVQRAGEEEPRHHQRQLLVLVRPRHHQRQLLVLMGGLAPLAPLADPMADPWAHGSRPAADGCRR